MGFLSVGMHFLIKKKLPDFCLFTKNLGKPKLNKLESFVTMFVMVHPLLNVFFINAIPPSKKIRTGLFYIRTLMLLTISSILGSVSGLSVTRILQEVSLSVDVYILLLPYFTFVPLEVLLRGFLSKEKYRNRKEKIIFYVGLALALLAIILCLFFIIAISEASTHDENIQILEIFGK